MKSRHMTPTVRLSLQFVIALVLGLAISLPVVGTAHADPGDLDPTFGDDGKVMTPLGQQPIYAWATAVLPDGKILAVGQNNVPSLVMTSGLVLARYNADGSLDHSFGDSGVAHLDLGQDSAAGQALALQPDGRAIVAGWGGPIGSRDVFLARFNSDGSRDTTFGTNGIVMTDVSGPWDEGQAVAIQADGRIVVVGSSDSVGDASDFAIVRYHPDGSLDTGFGENGIVLLDLGSPEDYGADVAIQSDGKIVVSGAAGDNLALARLIADGSLDADFASQGTFTRDVGFSGNALEIQPDGKIVVAGDGYTSYTGSILGLARLRSDGSLDHTFGHEGVVITDVTPGSARLYDFTTDVIIQPDGRIIAAGSTENAGNRDFAVARYQPGGDLDSSFGAGGLVATDFAGRSDSGRALALQSDGKIVAVGNTAASSSTFNSDFALARYRADGSLDSGFGAAGRVMSNFELGHSSAENAVVQTDGKILVAGSAYEGGQTGWDFAMVRYNSNGSLDPSFGHGGIITTDFGLEDDRGNGLAMQPDGRIVVAGTAKIGGIDRFAVARYLRNGALDPAFGSGGTVAIPFPDGSARGSAVAIQPDGKIVVAGNTYGYTLARYNRDGSLDTSFGNGGTATIDFGGDGSWGGASAIALQTDSKIVVAGTDYFNFALARFNSDGSLDHTFGQDGTLITDFGGYEWCYGVAIQADGKLVATGSAGNFGLFALARYHPNGSLDPAFGAGGIVTTDLVGPVWGGDVAIQPGGKILIAGHVFFPFGEGGGSFSLVRYQPDGALDETFGIGGVVSTDFGASTDAGTAIGIQTNGKIVVAGFAADTVALARYEGWDRVLATYLPVIMQTSEHHAGSGK